MLSKRTRLFNLVRGALALGVALLVALLLILLTTDEPLTALKYMLVVPATSWKRICIVLARMIPITFTGLAVCVMFSANQFNLAGEGCVMAGGFVSGLCAIYIGLPLGIHPLVCILVGALTGVLVMLVPALLKVKLGASEMVVSLMLNYVVLDVVLYFLNHRFADRSQGATMTLPYLSSAKLPIMFANSQTSYGLIIALAMAVVTWFFMYRTRWGYAIRMVGINKEFSRYSGIKVGAIVVLCQLVGGFLSGMGGAVEQMGYYQTFRWTSLMGYGWEGMTLAILARNNPLYIPVAAFFIAYLNYGCTLMNTYTSVPYEMMDIINAVIFLFFAAEQFLAKYRQKIVVKETEKELSDNATLLKGASGK